MRRLCQVGAGAVTVLVLSTGCTADPSGNAAEDPDGVTTLQPGRPGEPASTGPVEVPSAAENHADIAFVQMMIPHHAQAVTMAELAAEHAVHGAVRRLAGRIKAAQGPEILTMAAWLDRRGHEVPTAADDPENFDHSAHGHSGMEGMLTERQMDRLAAARGAAFDRMFLERMIDHHAGAIAMVDVVAVEGADVAVAEMAADVSVTQSAEIALMRDLLRRV